MALKYKKTNLHSKKKKKIIKSRSRRKSKRKISKRILVLDSGKKSNKNTFDIITLANCPYCSELIKLLEEKDIKYNNLEIQNDDTVKKNICNLFVKKVFKIEHNTFPKVFINGKFIGGLDKFRIYLKIKDNEKKNEKRYNIQFE